MGSGASTGLAVEAKEAVNILRNENDATKRIATLEKVKKNCSVDDNGMFLVSSELGLLAELKRILRDCKGKEQELAASCFWNLSRLVAVRSTLTSPNEALLPIIAANISMQGCIILAICCSLSSANQDYVLSREVGLVESILSCLSLDCDKNYFWFFDNVANSLQTSNLELFLSYDIIPTIMKFAKLTPVSEFVNDSGNIPYRLLNAIFKLSYFLKIAKQMKELDAVPLMTEIMNKSNKVPGLKAVITVCNMIGKEEATINQRSLIQEYPEKFEMLLIVLKKTLDKVDRDNSIAYAFGIVTMRSLCGAIRTLSVSDTNKPLMLKTKVLELLIQSLKLFVDNSPELSTVDQGGVALAGGGGDDVDTAEVTIESLLQLSFNYELDEKLIEVYTSASNNVKCNIIDILAECVTDSREKLSSEAKRNASSLLKRLKPVDKTIDQEVSSAAALSSSKSVSINVNNKHIMLSYSWAVNKHLVVAVGAKLKELGHEVWRDEEGSNILGPMSGDTDEMMASAIEHAHAVVIFVSPQYKESANCRTEAKYAKQRQLSHPLKILYVMMCENYHTRSNPPVDGWLALNIGTDLWYPLWNASMVNSTVQSLSDVLKGASSHSSPSKTDNISVAVPTSANNLNSSSTTPIVDWDTAWALLSDNHNVIDIDAMTKLMDDLGVTEKKDLEVLLKEELESLGKGLKGAKGRRFISAVGL